MLHLFGIPCLQSILFQEESQFPPSAPLSLFTFNFSSIVALYLEWLLALFGRICIKTKQKGSKLIKSSSYDLTGYLLKLQVKVVRVYSETIEQRDYPIPGIPGTTRKIGNAHEAQMDPRLVDISLHRLIRRSSNTHSKNILKYEQFFKTAGNEIKLRDILAYRKEISRAEVSDDFCLRNHKIMKKAYLQSQLGILKKLIKYL